MANEPIYESIFGLTKGTLRAGDYCTAIPMAYTWSVHTTVPRMVQSYIKSYVTDSCGGCRLTLEQYVLSDLTHQRSARMSQLFLPPPDPLVYYKKKRAKVAGRLMSVSGGTAVLNLANGSGNWIEMKLESMPAKLKGGVDSALWHSLVMLTNGIENAGEFMRSVLDMLGMSRRSGPESLDNYRVCTWLASHYNTQLLPLVKLAGKPDSVLNLPQGSPWTAFASMTLQLELVGYSTESRLKADLGGKLTQEELDAVSVSMAGSAAKLSAVMRDVGNRREKFVEDWLGEHLFAVVRNKVRGVPEDAIRNSVSEYIEKQNNKGKDNDQR